MIMAVMEPFDRLHILSNNFGSSVSRCLHYGKQLLLNAGVKEAAFQFHRHNSLTTMAGSFTFKAISFASVFSTW